MYFFGCSAYNLSREIPTRFLFTGPAGGTYTTTATKGDYNSSSRYDASLGGYAFFYNPDNPYNINQYFNYAPGTYTAYFQYYDGVNWITLAGEGYTVPALTLLSALSVSCDSGTVITQNIYIADAAAGVNISYLITGPNGNSYRWQLTRSGSYQSANGKYYFMWNNDEAFRNPHAQIGNTDGAYRCELQCLTASGYQTLATAFCAKAGALHKVQRTATGAEITMTIPNQSYWIDSGHVQHNYLNTPYVNVWTTENGKDDLRRYEITILEPTIYSSAYYDSDESANDWRTESTFRPMIAKIVIPKANHGNSNGEYNIEAHVWGQVCSGMGIWYGCSTNDRIASAFCFDMVIPAATRPAIMPTISYTGTYTKNDFADGAGNTYRSLYLTGNGTLSIGAATSAKLQIVGGGGGGGATVPPAKSSYWHTWPAFGGGGGGGGIYEALDVDLDARSYDVKIGVGGAGATRGSGSYYSFTDGHNTSEIGGDQGGTNYVKGNDGGVTAIGKWVVCGGMGGMSADSTNQCTKTGGYGQSRATDGGTMAGTGGTPNAHWIYGNGGNVDYYHKTGHPRYQGDIIKKARSVKNVNKVQRRI